MSEKNEKYIFDYAKINDIDESASLLVGESYTASENPFTVTENGIDVTASATITTT